MKKSVKIFDLIFSIICSLLFLVAFMVFLFSWLPWRPISFGFFLLALALLIFIVSISILFYINKVKENKWLRIALCVTYLLCSILFFFIFCSSDWLNLFGPFLGSQWMYVSGLIIGISSSSYFLVFLIPSIYNFVRIFKSPWHANRIH